MEDTVDQEHQTSDSEIEDEFIEKKQLTTEPNGDELEKQNNGATNDDLTDIEIRTSLSTLPTTTLQSEAETLQITQDSIELNDKYPEDFKAVDFGLCLFSGLLFLLDYAINLFVFQKYYRLHKDNDDFLVYCYVFLLFTISVPLITAIFEVVW